MDFTIDRGCRILVYSGLHLSTSGERHVRSSADHTRKQVTGFFSPSPIGDAAVMLLMFITMFITRRQ